MRRRLNVLAVVMTLLLIGCQGVYYKTIDPELVPLARYDEAITTMVAVKTNFNHAVNAEPDPKVKAKMLDIAFPLFTQADTALASWKIYLDAGEDPALKIQAYQQAWLQLVNVLLQLGIVEVK